MKAAYLIIACLENEGVECNFGVPGEENPDALYALPDSSIRFVLTRHERGAAFIAHISGRRMGKAGMCLSTPGPGTANPIIGVAKATMDRAPLDLYLPSTRCNVNEYSTTYDGAAVQYCVSHYTGNTSPPLSNAS
jgi:glyoxylate carboligase